MTDHIRDDDAQPVFVQRQIVKIVASDLLHRTIPRIEIVALQFRSTLRQKSLLQLVGEFKVGLKSIVLLCLFKQICFLNREGSLHRDGNQRFDIFFFEHN